MRNEKNVHCSISKTVSGDVNSQPKHISGSQEVANQGICIHNVCEAISSAEHKNWHQKLNFENIQKQIQSNKDKGGIPWFWSEVEYFKLKWTLCGHILGAPGILKHFDSSSLAH